MKVRTFIINEGQQDQHYKLVSEEGDVLRMQPASGWKTIRGAKAWAEKHGYEFVQEEKGANTMASKSTITNVVVETKFNTAYVYYSTGTEKMYPADKLPKTVAKWLAEHETAEEEADPVEEEPETVEEAVDPVEEVPETDDQEVAQNDQENAQIESESDQVELVSAQTHREPPRRLQTPPAKSLPLDIVEAVVSGLLMATRLSLIALAYLLTGLAAAVNAGVAAYEYLSPRIDSLIEAAGVTYHETVRPAGKAAAVWMAEAVWYVLI